MSAHVVRRSLPPLVSVHGTSSRLITPEGRGILRLSDARLVDQNSVSWNRLCEWLNQVDTLRAAALSGIPNGRVVMGRVLAPPPGGGPTRKSSDSDGESAWDPVGDLEEIHSRQQFPECRRTAQIVPSRVDAQKRHQDVAVVHGRL
jgi:hypothetical protein